MSYDFSNYDIQQQVLDFMQLNNAYPIDNSSIQLDGLIHRYRLNGDKGGDKSGAYCIFTDYWPAGWIQNWRDGKAVTWSFKRDELDENGKSFFTDDVYKKALELSRKHQAKLEKERDISQAQASERAKILFDSLSFDIPEAFNYFLSKRIDPVKGIRYYKDTDSIVIPLQDINGEIKSLQTISREGDKKFYSGAPTKGLFFPIGLDLLDARRKIPILICEGFATAVTIFQAVNIPVIAAMTCHNLFAVAQSIQAKHKGRCIVIMADNDHRTQGNPGLTHAYEASNTLGLAGVVSPAWNDSDKGTDWNDFYAVYGEDITTRRISTEIHNACSKQRENAHKKLLEKVKCIDAQTLRSKEFPPIKWAVEGFLPSGLSILAGGPKVGKSILALHLSLAVCTGGYAFGKIKVEQGDVLYLALEDTDRRLKERILGSDIDDEIDISRLKLATYVPRQHEGGMEYLRMWLEDHEQTARLVIIDTLQKFRKQLSGKNSMYSEDYDVVSDIKKLADEFDVPILVIHHLKKAMAEDWLNEISGSQGIAGAADTIFALKRARTEAGGILHRTGRDVEEKDFALTLDGYGWILNGDAELFTMPQWKKQILDYLREHNSVTPMELSQALNVNLKTAQTNIRRLAKEGLITKVGYGSYALEETQR